MSLNNWLNEGHLKAHETSKKEIIQLMKVFSRDIKDAQTENLSIDRKFATAYNAALIVARAALAAKGYRTSGEGNHYWTIKSLACTMELDHQTVNKLNKFRKKRNISDYEMTGAVTEQETVEMVSLAQLLYDHLEKWLKNNYPELSS